MPMTTFGFRATIATMKKVKTRARFAVDRAVRDEAHFFHRLVVQTIRKQGTGGRRWKKLNPITIALRKGAAKAGGQSSRGTKALVRTGSLRASVKVDKRGSGEYFVGVSRTAGRGKGGRPLVDIARIHETGMVVIPITDKMRRYFRYLYWKGAIKFPWPPAGKTFIVIPRRSFIGDTLKVFQPGFKRRLTHRYVSYVTGKGRLKRR